LRHPEPVDNARNHQSLHLRFNIGPVARPLPVHVAFVGDELRQPLLAQLDFLLDAKLSPNNSIDIRRLQGWILDSF
jgi:hypothetical protein